jgi:archaellin
MKRSRIAASVMIVATIVTASVISGLWMGGYLSPRKTEIKPPHTYPVSPGLKLLDITGARENAYESDLTCVTFLATIWAGNPGINIANLRVHWHGPAQDVVVILNTASPTVASATEFACDEVPVKTPRSANWNPGAKPPTFFLTENNIICISIDLTPFNGINDPLGAGKTASVYFEGVPGLASYESFTTPFIYGNNRLIDLTMQ